MLGPKRFVDVQVHFIKLTAPMACVNDRWSDDHHHVGMVVVRCRSRVGRVPYLG